MELHQTYEFEPTQLDMLLLKLHDYQLQLDAGEDSPGFREAAALSAREFVELIGPRQVTVSTPRAFLPVLDQYGHVIDAKTEPGTFSGLINQISISPVKTDDGPKDMFGMRLQLHTVNFDSYIEQSVINHCVFIPFKDMSLTLPPEHLETVMPEDNDEIAELIDIALLNAPVDLAGLADLVGEKFTGLTPLQLEYYQNYLNNLATFNNVDLMTERVVGLNEADNLQVIAFKFSRLIRGKFYGFDLLQLLQSGAAERTVHLSLGIINSQDKLERVLATDIQAIDIR